MTNTLKRPTNLSFSSLSHQSSLCTLDKEVGVLTQEPDVFSQERGHCTPRETDRENQKRGTLIVHALHLMKCWTLSEVKEHDNRLKSKVEHTVECR